jgi:hypothetical protein
MGYINSAFEGKGFKIHLGYISDIDNPTETFFTTIPYYDNDSMYPPQKVQLKKSTCKYGIVDFRTYGDCFPVEEDKNIIVIADNGNVYFVTLNDELRRKENIQSTYEFKLMKT